MSGGVRFVTGPSSRNSESSCRSRWTGSTPTAPSSIRNRAISTIYIVDGRRKATHLRALFDNRAPTVFHD